MFKATGRKIGFCFCVALISVFSMPSAWAETASANRASEALLIIQIALLIALGRGLGEIMQRIGQPSIIGQLLAGLLLGPSFLGWIWPDAQMAIFPANPEQKALLNGMAQFGILLLLLLTGMETDLKLVRRVGRAAITVSITGVVVPFGFGFLAGQYMPEILLPHPDQRLIASLFLGTALSISSVKIVGVVVREMNFMRRDVGQILIASAVLDDTIGWIIIAVILSLATQGTLDFLSIAKSVIGTLAFLAVSLTIGRRLVFILIRWANDHLVSDAAVVTIILLLTAIMALITHLIGVHTVLGAFVAGILVGESPILTKQIDEQLRGLITSLFMPVFFGLAGLSADLTVLRDPTLLALTGVLVVIASVGKFAGAFTGGELGGLNARESFALASGMNARGSTEVIVATIGLSMGVLSQNLFTMIVTMAVLTTMAMPPMLRAALARVPMRKDEKIRLRNEAADEKGFLSQLERFLLAVDESQNGKFASRIAGLLAGPRGVPTTVLHIGKQAKLQNDKRHNEKSPEAVVKSAAKDTAEAEETLKGEKSSEIEITTRVKDEEIKSAIAKEAEKGFDLLLVGLEKSSDGKGVFLKALEKIAEGFEGPMGVLVAKGNHLRNPATSGLKILVPISGNERSQRASEIGIALARSTASGLNAFHLATDAVAGGNKASVTRSVEEGVLKDVLAMAERFSLTIKTSVGKGKFSADAILRQAEKDQSNLIIMGVDRVPGDGLSFGVTASALLKKSKVSVLLFSGG